MFAIDITHTRPDARDPRRPLREHKGLGATSLAELRINTDSRGHPLSPFIGMLIAHFYKTRGEPRLDARLGAVTFDLA
eukprot:2852193-Pyramimonas_sp.AAC.1